MGDPMLIPTVGNEHGVPPVLTGRLGSSVSLMRSR